MRNPDYLTDNAPPCGKCLSTCACYFIEGFDLRTRCLACNAETVMPAPTHRPETAMAMREWHSLMHACGRPTAVRS